MRPFLALPLLALGACVDSPPAGEPAAPAPADTTWAGEVRMTDGDTTFRVCGTGTVYHLTGPAMDTIAKRYAGARMNIGQRMKLWVSGHFGTVQTGSVVDSALIAMRFQHLDASLRCDPIPDHRVAGDWKLEDADQHRPRDIHLHLYPDGSALMITDLRNGRRPFEEDGTWGVDGDATVHVNWPARAQTMLLRWTPGTLMGTDHRPGMSVVLHKAGEADRLAGAFGRTARWLAATATAQGRTTTPGDILPATRLDTLFPTAEARRALQEQALDTFGLDTRTATQQLDAAITARDYTFLLRAAAHH